ncbi:MAG: hypothetical protein KDA42_04595 [Planctomycetales bacterium]|nr:hypothetical protein [Planctomycetales bacterium]
MSIRFQCNLCGRDLRVADEKAGRKVRCPGCQEAIRVPIEDPVAAPPPVAPTALGGSLPPWPEVRPGDEPCDQHLAAPPADESVAPTEFVSLSRKALYAQGVLIAAVALLAFCLGYAVGGRVAPTDATANNPGDGPFQLDGTLRFSAGGEEKVDAGAVIVVLPRGPLPDERIPIDGLGPDATSPPQESVGVRAIESLGGSYRRTDGQGRFNLSLSKGGEYYVLLLSKNAKRLGDENISPDDLSSIASYFRDASDLLAKRRYVWEKLQVVADSRLDHTF